MKRLKILLAAVVAAALAASVPALANAATTSFGGDLSGGGVGNNSIANQSQGGQNAINTGDASVTQTGPTQTQYQYNPVNNTSSSAATVPVENATFLGAP